MPGIPANITIEGRTPATIKGNLPPLINTAEAARGGFRAGDDSGGGALSSRRLATKSDITGSFLGAFNVGSHPGTSDNGDAVNSSYAANIIAVSGDTVFISGTNGGYNTYRGDPVSAFSLPDLITPETPYSSSELNNTVQSGDWSSLIIRPTVYLNGVPTSYTGLHVESGKLYATGARDYDSNSASFSGNHLAVFSDPSDLVNSDVKGWYRIGDRNDNYLTGSITPIPQDLQSEFNGDTHLFAEGGAATISINGRLSMGPSLASGKLSDLDSMGQTGDLSINRLLEYSLSNPLWDKRAGGQYNATPATQADAAKNEPTPYGEVEPSDNELWTQLSHSYCGFIVPGTRTVAFLGRSGGHVGGVAYKAIQSNGNEAGGPAACEWEDYVNYYWLYDLSAVKNAETLHELEPYEYGVLTEVDNWVQRINNGDNLGLMRSAYFDSLTNRLYLGLEKRTSTSDSARSVVLTYQLGA